jgi:MFS family permease
VSEGGDATTPYRTSLWLTLIPGGLAVLSFAVLVRDARRLPNKHMRFWSSLRGLPMPFRRYLLAVGAFGIGDYAHTLLVLAATHLLTADHGVLVASELAGALYVLRNLVTALVAFPIGALADRVGHRRVLVVGYALGVATAASMALAFALGLTSLWYLAGVFVLAGTYTAIQDSLEDSLTAELVPAPSRGLAYGVLGSVNGVGDLVSSTGLGLLWSAISPSFAFAVAASLMAIGTLAMARNHHDPRGSSTVDG